jgi:8-oxo-dGTP pyrophosphatase MutT (NUDIX family)
MEPVRRAVIAISGDDLPRWQPPPGEPTRRSATLMLFGEGPTGPDLLLTERAHHMRSQPGQVSFPGGKIDPGETVVEAALRETQEETGVDPSHVTVLGELPELWLPPSNLSVTTVVGWSNENHDWVASPDEVHAIWRTPIAELVDPDHRTSIRHPSGWVGPGFLIGDNKDIVLWGFTAGIIDHFFNFLGWSQPWDEKRERDLPAHMLLTYRQSKDSRDDLDEET